MSNIFRLLTLTLLFPVSLAAAVSPDSPEGKEIVEELNNNCHAFGDLDVAENLMEIESSDEKWEQVLDAARRRCIESSPKDRMTQATAEQLIAALVENPGWMQNIVVKYLMAVNPNRLGKPAEAAVRKELQLAAETVCQAAASDPNFVEEVAAGDNLPPWFIDKLRACVKPIRDMEDKLVEGMRQDPSRINDAKVLELMSLRPDLEARLRAAAKQGESDKREVLEFIGASPDFDLSPYDSHPWIEEMKAAKAYALSHSSQPSSQRTYFPWDGTHKVVYDWDGTFAGHNYQIQCGGNLVRLKVHYEKGRYVWSYILSGNQPTLGEAANAGCKHIDDLLRSR